MRHYWARLHINRKTTSSLAPCEVPVRWQERRPVAPSDTAWSSRPCENRGGPCILCSRDRKACSASGVIGDTGRGDWSTGRETKSVFRTHLGCAQLWDGRLLDEGPRWVLQWRGESSRRVFEKRRTDDRHRTETKDDFREAITDERQSREKKD